MRGKRIVVLAVSVAVLGTVAAAPALAQDRTVPAAPAIAPEGELARISRGLTRSWTEVNRGGAPVSEEFALAALRQGLTAAQVRQIFVSQALGGPRTSATFSSPELLLHFTRNPDLIPALLSAVESVRGAPASYAAYLEAGGTPGSAYRSYNQLLQEAVLEISGAREAYLSGVPGSIGLP
jgi:hypothetical protein